MVTEDPQVPFLLNRIVRWIGHVIRVGEPFLDSGLEQLGELVFVEPDDS